MRSAATPSTQARERTQDLAELFDRLLTSSTDPEFQRLAGIYERHLEPMVVRHYRRNRRRRLERSLKALVVLRLLDVPYRSGCPISTGAEKNLLSSLSVHCRGAGLCG